MQVEPICDTLQERQMEKSGIMFKRVRGNLEKPESAICVRLMRRMFQFPSSPQKEMELVPWIALIITCQPRRRKTEYFFKAHNVC